MTALAAVAGLAGAVVAQPGISITPSATVVQQGQTFTGTISIDNAVDFSGGPNAFGGLPIATVAPPYIAPSSYLINVDFSGGGSVVSGSFNTLQLKLTDFDGFGPEAGISVFGGSSLNGGLRAQASDAAVAGTAVAREGLFTNGGLFTFQFQVADDFLGDIQLSIAGPEREGDFAFSEDVLDFGTGLGSTPGSVAGFGNAQLGTATITVVPTPGAAAILGLGGLMAARRRR